MTPWWLASHDMARRVRSDMTSPMTKHSDVAYRGAIVRETYMGPLSHYERLGVPVTASADEIRDAYRAQARVLHPDQGGPVGSSASMAAINEAYRVLRDPATRSRYDAELRARGSAAPTSSSPAHPSSTATYPQRPIDRTPARYPWKLVAGMAAVGATVVLVGAALYEPAEPARPDNVLETGSCVVVEANNDVREVTCAGADDLIVHTVVPFGDACPAGLSAHRDRQGMGMACIAATPPAP